MQFRVRNRQRTEFRVNRAGSTRIPHVASECLPGLSLATAQLAVTPPRDLCMTAGLHATRANTHALNPNPARGCTEGGREVWAGGLRAEVDSLRNACVRTRSAPRPRTARAQRPPPAAPTAAATTSDCPSRSSSQVQQLNTICGICGYPMQKKQQSHIASLRTRRAAGRSNFWHSPKQNTVAFVLRTARTLPATPVRDARTFYAEHF